MSNYEQESLSALMDGEADELELRRLLKAMDDDPALAQRWQRYHLAQSVLHDQGVSVSPRVAEGVAAALEHEPLPGRTSGLPAWQQHLTRLAVAACVAVVAVVALQPGSSGPEAPMVANTATEQATTNTSNSLSSEPDSLLAEATDTAVAPQVTEYFQAFFEAMRFDPEEPVRTEHLQDSPLYRLVNDYQTSPTP